MLKEYVSRLSGHRNWRELVRPLPQHSQIKDAEFYVRRDGIIFNADGYSHPEDFMIHNKQEFKHDGMMADEIIIYKTPGHTADHASLLLKTPKKDILLAGDLFWWKDNEEQKINTTSLINKEDCFATDQKKLQQSRKKMLQLADWIIPGHGNAFKGK